MKHLFLIAFLLVHVSTLMFGQGIRAAADTVSKPIRKISQPILPDTYTGRQLMVGSGGGFTGFTTTYCLFENGKLFRQRSYDTTFTLISQQTTARANRLFNIVENTCKIKKTRFNYPGNHYTFVQWRKGKQRYRVSWGMLGRTVPATYLKFVDSFMAMIPSSPKPK